MKSIEDMFFWLQAEVVRLPANENPWYVLATLYGESSDPKIIDKNREVWNTWACQYQYRSDAEREKLSAKIAHGQKEIGFEFEKASVSIEAWSNIEKEVRGKFVEAMRNRSSLDRSDISLPDPREPIELNGLQFTKPVHFFGFIFPSLADFEHSIFLDRANFMLADFSDGALFLGAHFKKCFDKAFKHN